MDRWLEEAEEIDVHPRDPYHRVDVVATDRHVRISVEGELVAETSRALALFETGLPTRWYMPPEDVLAQLWSRATRSPIARTRARPPITRYGWATTSSSRT